MQFNTHHKAELKKREKEQAEEIGKLKTKIDALRNKHNLHHVRSSFSDDIPSLKAELSSLTDAVGKLTNFSLSEKSILTCIIG
jgi:predicted nuclease with TOPRIM domain